MGRVFLAWDPLLAREVALKVLAPEYAGDAQLLERFRREARLASALNHPHICMVHDMGEDEGHPYIVMERVDGQTLAPGEQTRPSIERVMRIGSQVAKALAAAHAAGIVHRDIKPSNVMVRADEVVKVVDFGLARGAAGLLPVRVEGHVTLTEPGTLVGTVGYMSPEQARGREVDGASDVFSLGVVLYELATGAHPFQSDSPAELFQAILSHTPLPANQVDREVPAPFAALLEGMLARAPAMRPTAPEVAAALDAALGARPARSAGATREAVAVHTVGRREEQAELLRAFDAAADGHGLVLCVTGEPGIGKSTLLEQFLATLRASGRSGGVARGQCSERLAGSEAFLPVLEALEGLLQGEGGDSVARTMRTVAPSWYAQVVPGVTEDSQFRRVLQQGGGFSQERLKRELGALLLELSRQRPLVLLLEDIHWADASTIDLLGYLGVRCQDWHVLLFVTYRPADLLLSKHPFAALKLDLQTRGLCREVALEFLTREDVERYLRLEFPVNDFPAGLGDLVHSRTEGSPLFMADLLRYLRDRAVIVQEGDRWTMGRSIPDLADRLPESVRSMVQRKIEQLDEADARLLVAASVQGYEFDSAIVAEALDLDAAEVEERLDQLDRVRQFVREVEERELPDRTLTLRYRFVHVLYQNAMYASLRPTRRAELSRAIANALVARHGAKIDQVAAELALLFEGAREFEQAAHFFLVAARHAVRVFANQEAALLAQRGLSLIPSIAESQARDRSELALLVTLGPPLKDTLGWAAPEVVRVYARANELGERIQGTPDLFPALWGMWLSYSATADIKTLCNMGERMLAVARESGDAGYQLQAHHALTTTHFISGHFEVACHHAEQGCALYDPTEHREHAFLYGGHDPGSCCAGFAAQSLWMLGHPDRSLEQGLAALRMAKHLGHPVSLALAHWSLGTLHHLRRDVRAVREQAELCLQVALDQGAPIFPEFLLAWADAQEGRGAEALEQMREIFAQPEKIPLWWRVYFRGLLAEILAKSNRFGEALASIAKAYEEVGERKLGHSMAELHRLEGVYLHAHSPSRPQEALRAIRRAIDLARGQKARMLELRALVSLARLHAADERAPETRALLAERLAWFTEGLDTPDLQEARAVLEATS